VICVNLKNKEILNTCQLFCEVCINCLSAELVVNLLIGLLCNYATCYQYCCKWQSRQKSVYINASKIFVSIYKLGLCCTQYNPLCGWSPGKKSHHQMVTVNDNVNNVAQKSIPDIAEILLM